MNLAGNPAFRSSRNSAAGNMIRPFAVALFPAWEMWVMLAGLAAVNLIWIGVSQRISSDFIWMMTSWPIGLVCAWRLASLKAGSARLMVTGLKLVMLVSFSGSSLAAFRVFNHLANTTALPLVDDQLLAFDSWLGFDWLAYAKWVAAQPVLAQVLGTAYDAIYIVLFAIALLHVLGGREQRAGEVAALLVTSAVLCSAIGALLPAYGAMHVLGTPELLAALRPGAGTYAIEALTSVRADQVVLVSTELPGLTTCPSYHTALGLLAIYFCRGHRIALIATSLYAAVMIASTPVFGGHYLFDILAGGVFTFAVVLLWRTSQSRRTAGWLRESEAVPA